MSLLSMYDQPDRIRLTDRDKTNLGIKFTD